MPEVSALQHVLIVALMPGPSGDGDHLEVLLVKRKFPPFAGGLALPGGFVKPGETALHAALREIHDETHLVLRSEDLIELSPRTSPGRDPRGFVESKVFLVVMKKSLNVSLQPGTSVESCGWVKVLSIPELVFDHGAIVCEALSFGWPVLAPTAWRQANKEQVWQPLFLLPKILGAKDVFEGANSHDVIFFGGSFHPWHQGHRACLELCPNPHVVVVPDTNPWKLRKVGLAEQKRCFLKSLLELARALKNLPYAVYPGFWGSENENPTVDWLLTIQGISRSLLIGEDNFYSILKWKRAPDLLKGLYALYVAPRDCAAREENVLPAIMGHNPNLKIIKLSDHPYKHLSSTELRQSAKS
ncbi:MAG: NUDIX domain-containing protein [Bdellovibrio sp.]|nr:NUDIX domain-containing protein [Bdellovibrio sp.]